MRIPKEQSLYIRSMGKALRVTAIFTSDAEANAYMEKNHDEGVVSEFNGMIFIAGMYDRGVNISEQLAQRVTL